VGYNYRKLLGRIKECGYTQESLAKAIKMSPSTLNLKLNNRSSFLQGEIEKLCLALSILPEDIVSYFFTK
jgi:DNA-binding Xre family transcriptional regulator